MRLLYLFLITILNFISLYSAVSVSAPNGLNRRDGDETAVSNDESERKSTIVNGVEVPPMLMLNGETFTDDIKTGYW